jgi:hypothetical protein
VPRLNLDARVTTAVFQLPAQAKRENLFFVVMLYKTLYKGSPDEFLDFISKEKVEWGEILFVGLFVFFTGELCLL